MARGLLHRSAMKKLMLTALIPAALAVGVGVGCKEEKHDTSEAIEEMGDKIEEGAEDMKDSTEDALDEAGDEMEEAGEEVEDAVE